MVSAAGSADVSKGSLPPFLSFFPFFAFSTISEALLSVAAFAPALPVVAQCACGGGEIGMSLSAVEGKVTGCAEDSSAVGAWEELVGGEGGIGDDDG